MYFLRTALLGMTRALSFTLLSTLTLAAALWLLGLTSMALFGARAGVQSWGRGGHVTLGVAPQLPRARWEALRLAAAQVPGVAEANLVTPEAALAAFRARGAAAAALVEGVEAEMLPASVAVRPQASLVDHEAMEALASRLAALEGVQDVDYGALPIARLRQVVRWASAAVLALGASLAVTMTFMVTNTVRLVLVGRQEEVRILRLVGATAWFVRLPFLLEGAFTGVLAGSLAALGLRIAHGALQGPLQALAAHLGTPALALFTPRAACAQLVAGVVVGLVASYVAVGPYLHEDVA